VTGADRAEVRRLCDDAVHGIRLALSDAEFVDGRLTRALLGDELQRAVDRVFDPRHRHHRRRHQAQGPRMLPWLGSRRTTEPPSETATGTTCGVGALAGAAPEGAAMASDRPREGECRRCGRWRRLCGRCGLCLSCCTCNDDDGGPDEGEPWQFGDGNRGGGSGQNGSGGEGWFGGSGGGHSGGSSSGSGGSGGPSGSGGSGGGSGDGCGGGGGGCCNPCKCCCDCCD
jgi:hypothetical protein